MTLKTKEAQPVPADEVAQRIAEYRRIAFERQIPAQVVYHESQRLCPWPGCGHPIDGIHFQLEKWADAAQRERLLERWWRGPGLIALCPKCRRHVLFTVTGKSTVPDAKLDTTGLLPDDWHLKAHIVSKPSRSKQ